MTIEEYVQKFPDGAPESEWRQCIVHRRDWPTIAAWAKENGVRWEGSMHMYHDNTPFRSGPVNVLYFLAATPIPPPPQGELFPKPERHAEVSINHLDQGFADEARLMELLSQLTEEDKISRGLFRGAGKLPRLINFRRLGVLRNAELPSMEF